MNNELTIIYTPGAGGLRSDDYAGLLNTQCTAEAMIFTTVEDFDHVRSCGPDCAQVIAVDGVDGYYDQLNRVLFPAIEQGRHALFVSPGHVYTAADIDALLDCLLADSLYGFAVPRTCSGGSARIPVRGPADDIPGAQTYRETIQSFDPRRGDVAVTELPVLVSNRVLDNFGRLEGREFDLSDALARLYIRANRRGYSAVAGNRSLFTGSPAGAGRQSRAPQIEHAADYDRALAQCAGSPTALYEDLLWQSARPKTTRRVLFDIRNLIAGFNGTAEHIVSLLLPLSELAQAGSIDPLFWVSEQAADFHGLAQIIPGKYAFALADGDLFDASMRLSQPWSYSEIMDQAARSPVNAYLMLDSIARDCHYIRMQHIEGAWRAVAKYADGIVFNSGYTGKSFMERFPDSRNAQTRVAYCSLDPDEYSTPGTEAGEAAGDQDRYLLIVGNQYYHKGLYDTVGAVAAAFPEVKIRLLGSIEGEYPNVEMFPSGMLEHAQVDALYRDCACLVFPSFYEGFGLPVLKAVSYGKPVIARAGELIDEIIDNIAADCTIITFERTARMLRSINDVLNSELTPGEYRQRCSRDDHRLGWRESARVIIDLLVELMDNVDRPRLRARCDYLHGLQQYGNEIEGRSNPEQNDILFEAESDS